MKQKGDYRGWYYIPVHDRAALVARKQREEEEFQGRQG